MRKRHQFLLCVNKVLDGLLSQHVKNRTVDNMLSPPFALYSRVFYLKNCRCYSVAACNEQRVLGHEDITTSVFEVIDAGEGILLPLLSNVIVQYVSVLNKVRCCSGSFTSQTDLRVLIKYPQHLNQQSVQRGGSRGALQGSSLGPSSVSTGVGKCTIHSGHTHYIKGCLQDCELNRGGSSRLQSLSSGGSLWSSLTSSQMRKMTPRLEASSFIKKVDLITFK